jgi:Trk-type K+ transport system membrane component
MQSSIIYYHSAAVELIVALIMIAGTLSFGLHLALWRGTRAMCCATSRPARWR